MSVPMRRSAEGSSQSPAETSFHLRFLIPEAILFSLLGVLAVIVHGHPGPLPGDVGLELDVQHLIRPHPFLVSPIEALSTLNWPTPTIITLAVLVTIFLFLRRWLDAMVVPVAAGASSLATYVLSRWVHRVRPSGHGVHVDKVIASTFSFPSGHVTYAVTVFGLFLFLTYQVRRAIHPALVWAIRLVLVIIILLMPVSRMVEGEHWPSDTLAGALDGAFWLVLFAHLYLWARRRRPQLLAPDER